jgi:hypothetical protein
MGNVGPLVVSVIAGVIGLAMVAVLVSQKANTASVISGAGTALSQVIGAAVSPISGQSSNQFGSAG